MCTIGPPNEFRIHVAAILCTCIRYKLILTNSLNSLFFDTYNLSCTFPAGKNGCNCTVWKWINASTVHSHTHKSEQCSNAVADSRSMQHWNLLSRPSSTVQQLVHKPTLMKMSIQLKHLLRYLLKTSAQSTLIIGSENLTVALSVWRA